jgi:adenylate cyclase
MRNKRNLLICFLDLSTFARDSEHCDDEKVADVLDRYYSAVSTRVTEAGGTVVKFIGDGALVVFDPERADDAVNALLALRDEVNGLVAKAGWVSMLVVKLHCGEVIAGEMGPEKRFDVVGREVNLAARLQTRQFAISAEAFRALGKSGRALFKKHTPPVTYIPLDDRRPSAFLKM